MIATCNINDSGHIQLPDSLRQIFGAEPGARLRAEVTPDRIEIRKDTPEVTATSLSTGGRLVLAPTGRPVDSAKAVRETRDELARRAARP
jgi:bifunctional DNA-binding transcriptional regulator/antitoxin component of YhaV-PrlF toxin-antitoxin module